MSNTHTIADTMAEIMAREEDLLPACVISTTWPTVPVSSMALAAFTTQAYIRDGQHLVYADQPAITLTLSGSAGTYWLAISRDVSTAYATWTRRAGSHYLWQLAGARPPDVDGLLVFASVTVAGGVITAVTPAPGVTRAERWRTLAALGTMATQNANAVAVTGGNATGLTSVGSQYVNAGQVVCDWRASPPAAQAVVVNDAPAGAYQGLLSQVTTGANRFNLHCTGTALNYMAGALGLGAVPPDTARLHVDVDKNLRHGVLFKHSTLDVGGTNPIIFHNLANTQIGSISTSATATAFNTSSDARLKEGIQTLSGALAVVLALRPVSFRWHADGSQGHGFLAHELMQHIPEAVSGLPDEVNEDGSIKPQQVDHAKITVWLVAALQEAVAQLAALTARVASLEEALGV